MALWVCASLASAATLPGVVVTTVAKGSPAERAGMRPDDVLLGWETEPTRPGEAVRRGDIPDCFAFFFDLRNAEFPRGTVRLRATRNGTLQSFRLERDDWRLGVRPNFTGADLERYLEGAALKESGDRVGAGVAWRDLAWRRAQAGAELDAAYLFMFAADEFFAARSWDEGTIGYRDAIDAAARARSPKAEFDLRMWIGDARRVHDFGCAQESYDQALKCLAEDPPRSLNAAWALYSLGITAEDKATHCRYQRESLRLRQRLAPDSFLVGRTLNNLGCADLTSPYPDFDAAIAILERAVAQLRHAGSNELELAVGLTRLAGLLRERGDADRSEDLIRQALAIQERHAGESGDVDFNLAGNHMNLGNALVERGDLARAEVEYRFAIALRQAVAPEGGDVALSLANLSELLAMRGEMPEAREAAEHALAIEGRDNQQSGGVGYDHMLLCRILQGQGDPSQAEAHCLRAIELLERNSPGDFAISEAYTALSGLPAARHDWKRARELNDRALAPLERLVPGGLRTANTQRLQAELALKDGDLAEGERLATLSLATMEKSFPESSTAGWSAHTLAVVRARQGRSEEAARLGERAIHILENNRPRVGGSEEVQAGYGATQRGVYDDQVAVLVKLGRPAEAVSVVERSKARLLLEHLAARDLRFAGEVPAQLAQEGRALDAEHDRLEGEASDLSPATDQQRLAEIRRGLAKVREQQSLVRDRIRRASPRFAALKQATPLDAVGMARALDPGTAILVPWLGEEQSFLFASTAASSGEPARWEVYPLLATRAEVTARVEAFRSLLLRSTSLPASRDDLRNRGRELYDLLFRPAEPTIAPWRGCSSFPTDRCTGCPWPRSSATTAAGLSTSPSGSRSTPRSRPRSTPASVVLGRR